MVYRWKLVDDVRILWVWRVTCVSLSLDRSRRAPYTWPPPSQENTGTARCHIWCALYLLYFCSSFSCNTYICSAVAPIAPHAAQSREYAHNVSKYVAHTLDAVLVHVYLVSLFISLLLIREYWGSLVLAPLGTSLAFRFGSSMLYMRKYLWNLNSLPRIVDGRRIVMCVVRDECFRLQRAINGLLYCHVVRIWW